MSLFYQGDWGSFFLGRGVREGDCVMRTTAFMGFDAKGPVGRLEGKAVAKAQHSNTCWSGELCYKRFHYFQLMSLCGLTRFTLLPFSVIDETGPCSGQLTCISRGNK